jgi:3-hydroxybutyryl-CoA dehydratase
MDRLDLPTLGRGFYWQELEAGQRFRTYRRTVTESDLVAFINATGMLEAIFIDAEYSSRFGAVKGRLVPAALTYGLIEGMLFQSMIQGTGLAMLELHQKAVKPVLVGDSVWATVEVTGVRPTSKDNRAIVSSDIAVFNQKEEPVLTYQIVRMLAGRPASDTEKAQ